MRRLSGTLHGILLLACLGVASPAWAGGGGGGGGSRTVSVPSTALLVLMQLGAVAALLKRRP